MNLFDKAKTYYQQLLDEGSNVNCYWGLSNVNQKQGEYDITLAYQCLAIEQCQDRVDLLLRSYKYISLMYLDIYSIVDALEYQLKALSISQIRLETDHAFEYFFQALDIYKELNMFDYRNYPEQIFEYDSSSDEEPMFKSE